MSAQQCLDVGAETIVHRREMSDGLTAANDGVTLAPVLDRVEEISEVPSRVGGGDIRHVDQIIRERSTHGPAGPTVFGLVARFDRNHRVYVPIRKWDYQPPSSHTSTRNPAASSLRGRSPQTAGVQTLTTAENMDSRNAGSGADASAKTATAFPLLNDVEM